MSQSTPEIILFHYPISPYAHKVVFYLALRNIPHKQCMQPLLFPRKDLSSLGITYRRIPLLAIDNEVFCDTRLILPELERRFPGEGSLGNEQAKHWEKWSDKLLPAVVGCLPFASPMLKDPKFIEDRWDYMGRELSSEAIEKARPTGLEGVAKGFEYVEGIFKDRRKWIAGTEKVSLADINAIWPLEWLANMPGAFDGSRITKENFPKTFDWISRFDGLLPKEPPKDNLISGEEAKELILSKWKPMGKAAEIDTSLGIQFGEEVEVVPVDTGKNHPQRGRVRGLTSERVVLEVVPTAVKKGEAALRVIFPREGFEIRSCSAKGDARL